MLIDTHCHLDFPPLFSRLPEVLSSASACGVQRFILPGVGPQSWDRIISLAAEESRIFAAPGVHPMEAGKWSAAVSDRLLELVPDIVAIGEIGLDYTEGMPLRELQKEVFRAQLKIARIASLPVIIHCRRAFADTLQILADEGAEGFGGVMHAFSGSFEIARDCISMGLKIGIAGSVTWRNAIKPLKLVGETALEHLLLETDSPDMSPEPHRGYTNEPAFLSCIGLKVAEIKGESVDDVAKITSENARSLFRLSQW
jgi:TatD DNase family protein